MDKHHDAVGAARILILALVLFPVLAQAQYTYSTNLDNTITITRYTGLGGVLAITNTINGLSVAGIGADAFASCTNLTNITIPNSVTNIGDGAFQFCVSLTSITLPNNVTTLGDGVFFVCTDLSSITMPGAITNLGASFFEYCTSLTSVIIPNTVTAIGSYAFTDCSSLASVYFTGNAPGVTNDTTVFAADTNPTVYYLPGTTGWGLAFDGVPAVAWNPQAFNLGVVSNQFGFAINGPTNLVIVVEASTSLVNAVWVPLATNTLTGGSSSFTDPQSTNYSSRFYRFRPQ